MKPSTINTVQEFLLYVAAAVWTTWLLMEICGL
jgi:hypothetical protein